MEKQLMLSQLEYDSIYLHLNEYKDKIYRVYTDWATVWHNGKLGTVTEVGLWIHIEDLPHGNFSFRVKWISNNEGEFLALIKAMEILLHLGIRNAMFLLDSQIVVNRANGLRPKGKNANTRMDAFQDQVLSLSKVFEIIHFVWVPRECNLIADQLSKDLIQGR